MGHFLQRTVSLPEGNLHGDYVVAFADSSMLSCRSSMDKSGHCGYEGRMRGMVFQAMDAPSIPSGHQTWRAGKSPSNGRFYSGTSHIILVGGFKHFSFFHMLGIIIPIDFHFFQRGRAQPPTRYIDYP